MYKNLVATVLLVSKTCAYIRTRTSVEKNVKPLNGKMLVNQVWVNSAPLCTCTCISLCSKPSLPHHSLNQSMIYWTKGLGALEWVTIFIWISLTPGGNEGKGGTVQFCECSVFLSHAKTFYFYWDNWVGNIKNKTSIPAGHLLKWGLEGEEGNLVQPWLSPGNKRINTMT